MPRLQSTTSATSSTGNRSDVSDDQVAIALSSDQLGLHGPAPPPINLFASTQQSLAGSRFSSAVSLLEIPLNSTEEVFETISDFLRSLPSLPYSCRAFLSWALATTLLSALPRRLPREPPASLTARRSPAQMSRTPCC